MASKHQWMRYAADRAELAEEVLPGQTVVELIGEGRVLIEGHDGVSEYSDREICIKVRYGVVKIVGCNLKLTIMDKHKLVISGTVQCVELMRRSVR